MSRAFVKEDGPQPDEDPPEKPLSPNPNYVTPRGARLLHEEEERLVAELAAYSGTQSEPSRRRRKRELERDLRYVRARLESAIPVDPASVPQDQVRFGAHVRVRSDAETRVLRIVGEDEAQEGGELVPWSGPFTQALFGLKAGQSLDWDGRSWLVESIDYPLD